MLFQFNGPSGAAACWTVGSDGWTVLCATSGTGTCNASATGTQTGTCYTAVSTAGNDGTCTASTTSAGAQAASCLTLSKGKSLLRDGKPDWLMLNKGDTWTDQTLGALTVSGVSATAPILITSYGAGARPLIKTKASVGDFCLGSTGSKGDYVAMVGIECYSYTRNPDDPGFNAGTVSDTQQGFWWLPSPSSSFHWALLEDNKFSFYDITAVQLQPPSLTSTFRMRRNVIVNNYELSSIAHSQGIYIEGVGTPYFEENIWDHNGWNATVSGGERTIFNRNVYIADNNGPATVLGETNTQSASEGVQLRSGGMISNNLFVLNSSGFDVGQQGSPTITTATAYHNVVLQSDDISPSLIRGQGLQVFQASGAGIQVTYNLIAHITPGAGQFGWCFLLDATTTSVVLANNTCFDWPVEFGILDNGSGNTKTPNCIDLNGTNNNPGGTCSIEPFPTPTRTIATYLTSISIAPATTANFIALSRAQSKDNWNPLLQASAVNIYIRGGFSMPYLLKRDLDPAANDNTPMWLDQAA